MRLAGNVSAPAEWFKKSEMPFEVPLPPSQHYHTIFTCPVSRCARVPRRSPNFARHLWKKFQVINHLKPPPISSRELGSKTNMPMRLPCGHVICVESLRRMSRGMRRRLKCAYCPTETLLADCKEVHF